jgi:YtkA-like protein
MFWLPPRASAPLAFMACSALGCGSSDEDPPGAATPTVSCVGDPRLDSYSGELDKAGERGLLSFRFFNLEPSPPARGNNTFHVEVRDAAGAEMQGDLRVDSTMPDHGHGTSVEPVITPDPALGSFTVEPLYLFMPGVWRLRFSAFDDATASAPLLDSVVLHFCVEG